MKLLEKNMNENETFFKMWIKMRLSDKIWMKMKLREKYEWKLNLEKNMNET